MANPTGALDARYSRLAETFEAKYGRAWHFDVGDGAFRGDGYEARVFRVAPTTVFAFAKGQFARTRFSPSSDSVRMQP